MNSQSFSTKQAVKILLVEDDEVDAEVVSRLCKKMRLGSDIYRATSGLEALDFLRGINNKEKIPQPFVMIVDINLPQMTGLELLAELRRDENLRQSVVFILTTSDTHEDKESAYRFNAAGYILKSNTDNLMNMLRDYCQINEFNESIS